MNKKQTTKDLISAIAISASTYSDMFDNARLECEYHALNTLTKDHNCFHGNTKTECRYMICPLKGEE